ncbi:hypothetical protein [Gallionella capsiferriformans]|uniref:Uncharacterized protein n=1 Tax=Gallionella capsiferriformans (strain ES-2) TaxID=395494 RepID=D9SGA4_GALCS|nr:hypothetical protein [Gallionella capsiferriformans]ADL55551.1 hypothetical protein Galf_1532 [Gallionella capsiferriformans ES-2]
MLPAHFNQRATTPTNLCRIPIFAPTRRPHAVTACRFDTPWGWAQITGRLGQQHRDLHDAARLVAVAEEWTSNGCMHLKVDPAKLRAAMGGDTVNNALITKWMRDMRAAEIIIYVKELDRIVTGGIISEFDESADKSNLTSRPGAFTGDKPRRFIRISFSSGWSKLIESDRSTKYCLDQVVALKHGFSQAVARFCLSHANVNETVIGLIKKLNAEGRMRVRRADLAEDAERLARMGIYVNGDQIKYRSPAKSGKAPAKSGARPPSPVKTVFSQ